jgi:hypothetical protein
LDGWSFWGRGRLDFFGAAGVWRFLGRGRDQKKILPGAAVNPSLEAAAKTSCF